jgi:hypothetical protein
MAETVMGRAGITMSGMSKDMSPADRQDAAKGIINGESLISRTGQGSGSYREMAERALLIKMGLNPEKDYGKIGAWSGNMEKYKTQIAGYMKDRGLSGNLQSGLDEISANQLKMYQPDGPDPLMAKHFGSTGLAENMLGKSGIRGQAEAEQYLNMYKDGKPGEEGVPDKDTADTLKNKASAVKSEVMSVDISDATMSKLGSQITKAIKESRNDISSHMKEQVRDLARQELRSPTGPKFSPGDKQ